MPSMYKEGVVSVWIGIKPGEPDESIDVLKDLCGVEHYDLDAGEGNANDNLQLGAIADLVQPLSYSKSFIDAAVKAAHDGGIEHGRWVTIQYDFAYDLAKTVKPVADDPQFIGVFPYSTDG
jgi:hypothetical protein